MEPLHALFDEPPASPTSLPSPLAELYGGGLDLDPDAVYANFVSSLDGAVSLGRIPNSPPLLSGRSDGDRFVMGLLRALADCVLVGAGTLRADRGHRWTPASAHPVSAERYASLGRPEPQLVVVSAGGHIDPALPALRGDHLVLTGDEAAIRLKDAGVNARSMGEPPFTALAIVEAVRAQGHRRVLVEAGPTLTAQLVEADLLDELFLTLSPLLAGRRTGDGRMGLLEGVHLLPGRAPRATLRSLRLHGSHLMLRYAL